MLGQLGACVGEVVEINGSRDVPRLLSPNFCSDDAKDRDNFALGKLISSNGSWPVRMILTAFHSGHDLSPMLLWSAEVCSATEAPLN